MPVYNLATSIDGAVRITLWPFENLQTGELELKMLHEPKFIEGARGTSGLDDVMVYVSQMINDNGREIHAFDAAHDLTQELKTLRERYKVLNSIPEDNLGSE